MWRVMAWLAVAFWGLLPRSPWLAQEPKLRDSLEGHTDAVRAVAYSPDGKTLASGGEDDTIKLWDIPDGKRAGR